jgi:hypothetical protein
MLRKKSLLTLIVFLGTLLLLNSCYKDRFSTDKLADSEYNPELAAPLVKTKLTMSDVTENSSEEWLENPDGLLSLIYRRSAATDLITNLVEIPDQYADTTFQVFLPPSMIPGDSTSKLFSFMAKVNGSNNEILDSLFFKAGFLDFDVTFNMNHDSKIDIIIPGLTKHGVTFIRTIDIPATNGSTQVIKKSFSIVDYVAQFQHPNGNDNEIEEFIKIYVNFGPSANNSPYQMNISQGLRDVEYYFASGYFGQYDFDIAKEVLGVSLFDNSTVDEVFLEDPRLYLNFYNSFGIPIEVTMDEFYVEKDGNTMNVVSTNLPTFDINKATTPGTYDTTVITLDKNNSNIIDLFNFQPKKVAFKEKLRTNPLGLYNYNYLDDTSQVKVEAVVELPLYGRTLNFTLRDSTDIEFDKIDEVQSVEVRLNLANEFPAEAKVQLYLADSNSVILDSLLAADEMVLVPAVVGAPPDYRTSQALNKTTVVTLSGERLKHFWEAKRLVYVATMSTADQGSKVVKIYSDYGIDIRLAVKLNYLTEI